MANAYIFFNGARSHELGKNTDIVVKLLGTIKIPTPQKRYDTITIPGRDGLLYEEDAYDDIEIPLDLEVQDIDTHADALDVVKNWLRNITDNRLSFWFDEKNFYRVNQVELKDFERKYERYGVFSVTFICEPYRYQTASDTAIGLTDILQNNYATSKPIYIITGPGACTLTINGKSVSLMVEGELTINTDKQLCYKSKGVFANKAMTGEFSDLFLKPGKNTFKLTNGFSGKIITNMRKL
ncbi:MAG: phage tail family protein [Eubacterium sp.]